MTGGGLQTQFAFTLPKGYVDRHGTLHRQGTMRLATARDEIEPLRDPRVTGADDPFLTIVVLSRVITELGELPEITAATVEGLFAADLAFLQDVYGIINFGNPDDLVELQQAVLGYDFADDRTDIVEMREPALDVVQLDRPAVSAEGSLPVDISELRQNVAMAGLSASAAGERAGNIFTATSPEAPVVTEAPLRRRAIEEVRSTHPSSEAPLA